MPAGIGAGVGSVGGAAAGAGTAALSAGASATNAATSIASGLAATGAAGAEAGAAMANMTELAKIQNAMALNKGVLELGKEGSKAMSTFMADSGKAATAQ